MAHAIRLALHRDRFVLVMEVSQELAALKQGLLATCAWQSLVMKEKEDMQLRLAKLNNDCQQLKAENSGLLASLAACQGSWAEDERLLSSLSQSVQDLSSARKDLVSASQAAARYEQECGLLKTQNQLLGEQLASLRSSAALATQSMKEQHDEALLRQQREFETEVALLREHLATQQSCHDRQVGELQQKIEQERRTRQAAEQTLEKERKSLQASMSSMGSGQSGVVASLKERIWALRTELDAVRAERDTLQQGRRC